MKEVKLIEDAIRQTNEDGIRQMLEQFIRANTVVKDEKLDLSKFVSKENLIQPSMTGILHENGLKVATDGHILVAIYSYYKSEFEGKVITPKGEIVDSTYPNWKSVLPSPESLKTVKLSNLIADALRKIKHAETIAKISGKQVFVSITCDGEKMNFRSDYFTKFLTFLRTYPGASMSVRQNSFLYASNHKNLCLLMSLSIGDDCVVVDL
jgi:predicted transcriptional regulator